MRAARHPRAAGTTGTPRPRYGCPRCPHRGKSGWYRGAYMLRPGEGRSFILFGGNPHANLSRSQRVREMSCASLRTKGLCAAAFPSSRKTMRRLGTSHHSAWRHEAVVQGEEKPPNRLRVCTCQKSIRTGASRNRQDRAPRDIFRDDREISPSAFTSRRRPSPGAGSF
jgi:hypothetical protein